MAAVDAPSLTISVDGHSHQLTQSQQLVIGRGAAADIVLSNPLISRRHLLIGFKDGWFIEDLGSRNGVFVDSQRIERREVTGDLNVRLGDAHTGPLLQLHLLGTPVAPAAPPRRRPVPPPVTDTGSPLTTSAPRLPGRPPARPRPSSAPPSRTGIPVGNAPVTIGRRPGNNVVVPDLFTAVQHARITPVPGALEVQSLTSHNGTYVNGRLVTHARLNEGDTLTTGNSDFTVVGNHLVDAHQAFPQRGGLDVSHLSFTVEGGKKLLDDIDFRAPRGSLTAVIGPSGAGKSTLVKTIAGLQKASTGLVSFDGFDVDRQYEIAKTRIGMVPQDDVIHRQLKLRTALEYAARLRLGSDVSKAERDAQVLKAVAQLDLEPHLDTRIDRLSGGQRKRASVAMELLTEPSLLILDEPTSGLDPALDRQLMQAFRRLADGDRTVLVITHSVAELDLCDQVLVLVPGGAPAYIGHASQAASQFGTDSWTDIFTMLKDQPAACRQRWAARQRHRPTPQLTPAEITEPGPKRNWLQQTWTLVRRQVSLTLADRGYSLFLLALPFIIGLLPIVVPGDRGLTRVEDPKHISEPQTVLALLIIGAVFTGISMTIRDLVGERSILLRERAVSLPASAYLASKVFVFGLLGWVSAAIMLGMYSFIKPLPEGDGALGLHRWIEVGIALGVTVSIGVLIGLVISALVTSQNQVMPLLIVVLMLQMVLNGGLIALTSNELLNWVSWAIPARWTFALGAVSIDLNDLTHIADPAQAMLAPTPEADSLWEPTATRWWSAFGVVNVMGLLALAVSWLRLRRQQR